jgi:hypothetical protein
MVHGRWIGVLIITVAVVVSPVVAVGVVPIEATSTADDPPTNGDDPKPGEQAGLPLSSADTPGAQAPTDTSLVDVDPDELPGAGTSGDPYIITNASELQAMEDDLDAAYRLSNDINASETAEWNGGDGFAPVGPTLIQPFGGTFDGAGHSITSLTIRRPDTDDVGLFGYINKSGQISDLRLRNVSITVSRKVGGLVADNQGTVAHAAASGTRAGSDDVGGLVGVNEGTVRNASANATVNGSIISVGGLVGDNEGTVSNASASGPVNGSEIVGGLVGLNEGTVRNASASGTVTGSEKVGGLVGDNDLDGTVRNASASGTVTSSKRAPKRIGRAGGLVGVNDGTVRNASASGAVNGSRSVGGLVGVNLDFGMVRNASASGPVNGSDNVGGLVGVNDGTVRNASASGSVNGSDNVGGLVGENGYYGTVVNGSVNAPGQPGFGIGAAIAGIGGAGYILKRRLAFEDDQQ